MRKAYDLGYLAALEKLGMKTTRRITDPTPTEMGEKLDTADDHTPAGGFAQALATMDTPDYGARKLRKKPSDTPENRLERDVQWSNAQDIPEDYMTGATTMIPGGGL